jgi:hypothetical protein
MRKLVLAVLLLPLISVTAFAQAESGKRRDGVYGVLRQYGAKSLNAGHTEFRLNDYTFLRLIHTRKNTLAAIQVFTRNSKNNDRAEGQICKGQFCCISPSSYSDLKNLIDRLKPLGAFQSADTISAIPTSGQVNSTDSYLDSTIVRVHRVLGGPESQQPDCTSAFTVYYWLPLSGRIASKRIDQFPGLGFSKYFINIGNADFGVSQADYEKSRVGQKVVLRFTISNDLVQILEPFTPHTHEHRKLNGSDDAKVNEAIKLIRTMFKERKVRETFERYFLFSNLSPEEKRAVDAVSLRYLDEHSAMDAGTVARILAVSWNYEYQSVLLALRTRPLSDFDEAVEQAGSEIENERKRILSKRGLSENDFYNLLGGTSVKDSKTLEHNLTTLETINADIGQLIEQRTNDAVLAKNLMEMEKSVSVKNISKTEQAIYVVGLKPMFEIVFVPRGGMLKIIAFGDVL